MSEYLMYRWAGHGFAVGLGFAILLLLAESWWPRARSRLPFGRRWLANAVTCLSTVVVLRWLPPLSLLAAALLAQRHGWGLFNGLTVKELVAISVSWLAIDLSRYLVHRLEHRSPLLWRIHRLHHSDPDVDVTTTYRFHPFEVMLRSGVQVLVVFAVGVPPVAALRYLLLSGLTSVLSHANLRLPLAVDQAIGVVVITPNIHRTHHSIDLDDANSNFCVCSPIRFCRSVGRNRVRAPIWCAPRERRQRSDRSPKCGHEPVPQNHATLAMPGHATQGQATFDPVIVCAIRSAGCRRHLRRDDSRKREGRSRV